MVDTDTSLLVTVPAACGLAIQLWKCQRATGLALVFRDASPSSSLRAAKTAAKGWRWPRLVATRLEAEAGSGGDPKKSDAAAQGATSGGADGSGGGVASAADADAAAAEREVAAKTAETMMVDRLAIAHLSMVRHDVP